MITDNDTRHRMIESYFKGDMIGIVVLTNSINNFSNVNAAQQHSRLVTQYQESAVTTLMALLGCSTLR